MHEQHVWRCEHCKNGAVISAPLSLHICAMITGGGHHTPSMTGKICEHCGRVTRAVIPPREWSRILLISHKTKSGLWQVRGYRRTDMGKTTLPLYKKVIEFRSETDPADFSVESLERLVKYITRPL